MSEAIGTTPRSRIPWVILAVAATPLLVAMFVFTGINGSFQEDGAFIAAGVVMIFGYCGANDVSIRDWQLKTSQWALGKSFDTHCPYGPWIVTPDEIGDPHALGIRCFVNGEPRQESNTKQLIYNCFEQVALLSQAMTLEPGDLILTGTPGGVGIGFKPARWLKAGDIVRVEIDRIGVIESRVEAEPI